MTNINFPFHYQPDKTDKEVGSFMPKVQIFASVQKNPDVSKKICNNLCKNLMKCVEIVLTVQETATVQLLLKNCYLIVFSKFKNVRNQKLCKSQACNSLADHQKQQHFLKICFTSYVCCFFASHVKTGENQLIF